MFPKKSRFFLITCLILLACAALAFVAYEQNWLIFNDTSKEQIYSPNSNDPEQKRAAADSTIAMDLAKAKTTEEKYRTLLSMTTVSLDKGDEDAALEYAQRALALKKLSTIEKFSAEMNLVNVYGVRQEFDKGLAELAKIRKNDSLMKLEGSEFYVKRYEDAYKNQQMPGELNCKDPQKPEDCPL